jgi:hypothetical protein
MPGVTAQNVIAQKSVADQPSTAVACGAASVTVAAANPDRAEITIQNDHATQIIYLNLGPQAAVLNEGIRLNAAGGSWTSQAYTGQITGIATGATTPALVTEV